MKKEKNDKLAAYLKELGRGVIQEKDLEEYDETCDNNSGGLMGYECIKNGLAVCRIMLDDTMTIEERRRKAYNEFNSQDHNGSTASWVMSFIRRFCNDGETVADEIKDFKYDRKEQEELERHREWLRREYEREAAAKEKRKVNVLPIYRMGTNEKDAEVPIYTTNGPMFLIEYPYRYTMEACLKITRHIGSQIGLCYGIFNGVPMFSFDTLSTFFRRQHNGLTEEDHAEFLDALRSDNYDSEKADRILKERTWPHLGKTL